MKTKNNTIEKEFDTVKTFRAIKEKMSLEMSKMDFDEIKKYLKQRSQKLHINFPFTLYVGDLLKIFEGSMYNALFFSVHIISMFKKS